MGKIQIKWDDLDMAVDISDYETVAYLDKNTGEVVTKDPYTMEMVDEALEADSLAEALKQVAASDEIPDFSREFAKQIIRIEWDTEERYIEIARQDSRDGYSDMEAYIESIEDDDEHLAENLSIAIDGKGAFRRFKNVLLNHPDAREAWFEFERQRKQKRALDWLEDHDIEAEFV